MGTSGKIGAGFEQHIAVFGAFDSAIRKSADTEMEDAGAITIRTCESLEDIDACLNLQEKTWSKDDTDLMPRSGFLIARSSGGQVFGAWRETAGQDRRLAGFALAYISVVEGETFLYSHLLAVDPASRNLGIGRALKLRQREDALQRGIKRIEWTFDPLEIKNSAFNITGLGAVVRRYKPNYYGDSASPLQGKLPTDRLIAEWWLHSDGVRAALQRRPVSAKVEATIQVPAMIDRWKSNDATRSLAADVQNRNRERFQAAFEQKLAVIGFERDSQGNGAFQLGYWQECD
jgi:predicted GNAT superfamily acetyltransferase